MSEFWFFLLMSNIFLVKSIPEKTAKIIGVMWFVLAIFVLLTESKVSV